MEAVCIWTMSLLLALYGLWITIRALQQIRNPTHVGDLGIRWFTNSIEYFTKDKGQDDLDEALTSPATVRLVAGMALCFGVGLMGIPVFLFIMVRWVQP